MKGSYLTTSQVAQSVGVHPNTVRLYEEWGFLPRVKRSPAGYRLFTEAHRDQMRLARTALNGTYPGKGIRKSAAAVVRCSATGDLGGALELAYGHLALIQSERVQAEAAVKLLERWATGTAADATREHMQIREVAALLKVSTDALRNWERNGLIRVPRHPRNRYRLYSSAELGRLRVIRMLRSAGYSMMAILRMLRHLDQGQAGDLGKVLDTPRPDEDICTAADRWISALAEQETRAREMIRLLEEMIHKKAIPG